MRYFIISDAGGNPIYYDHPDGRMLSLILVNTHIMMKENLGQRFKSMTCGQTLFVFQKYEKLSYLVVSDQGESEMFLRSLLRQIFEHMVMVFGRQAIEEGKYSTFSRHKTTIQHIIDTLCALSDRHQSLLVRANERLEVDDRTRGECFKALKNALKQEPLATHGLLFVGTKLLVTYSKNKVPDIDPSDMLLLINDFRATFHPYEREVVETVIPTADYAHISSTLSTQESGERDRDDGFVSASEELTWDEDGKITQDNIRLLSLDLCEGLYSKVCLKVQELEKQKEAKERQKEREKINKSSESFKRLFVSNDDPTSLTKPTTTTPSNKLGEDDDSEGSARRKKKTIRRKSSRAVKDEEREQLQEQREKELDKRKQEGEQEETVESTTDILVADFLESVDKNDFQIGFHGDCVLLLQEMLHLISFFPGALDSGFGEKSKLSVSAFQETSRIPITGSIDPLTVKLLLEQVLAHFKKPKKKKVAFANEHALDSEKTKEIDGEKHGRNGKGTEDEQGETSEGIESKRNERRSRNRKKRDGGGNGNGNETFLFDDSHDSDLGKPVDPLVPSSPLERSAMMVPSKEDSSSSDESGFVSPLSSPHQVASHRSLKEEIERKKELEQEEEEGASSRLDTYTTEATDHVELERSKETKHELSADARTSERENHVGESSEDLAISLDEVDYDQPFPELDYNLRQPFDPVNSTAYKLLHLRTPKYTPRWVYYAELERMTTLVIITSNHPTTGAKGQQAERERLDEIRDELRGMIRNYATYLITKEHTHLPVLSFLHQFPGLIHFIFVDRTFNRVIAPPITAVHGPLHTPKSEEALRMKFILRSKVWDMCFKAQQHLAEGHHAMTMKSGAFQYSYRVWVEDMEGFELPFNHDQPFIAQRGPQTHKFYKKMVEHIFPSRSGLRCYELYTLYLGVLSVKSITHYDRNLVAILLDRKNK